MVALEYLRAKTRAPSATGEFTQTPKLISAMVSSRFSSLGADFPRLVGPLSLCGRPLPLSILTEACELPTQNLESLVAEGIQARLLVETPDGVTVAGKLLGETVRASMSTGERIATHRKIADALISLREPTLAGQVAAHLLAAGEVLEGAPYVQRGARQAIDRGSCKEARDLLERALSAYLPLRHTGALASLLGHVLTLDGEFRDAETAWSRASRVYRLSGEDKLALECDVEALRANLFRNDSDLTALERKALDLQAEASDRGFHDVVAQIMKVLVRIADSLGDPAKVRGLTAVARRSLRRADVDAFLEFLAVCMVDAVYGSPDSAAQLADQAFQIASELGDIDMALRALNWKVIAYYHLAELNSQDGRALVAQAVDVASGAQSLSQRFRLHANLGVWHMDAGEPAAAERAFERASQLLHQISAPHLRRNLLLNQGQLAWEQGDYANAQRRFLSSLQMERIASYEPAKWVALAGLGLTNFDEGNISVARHMYRQLPQTPSHWTFDPYLWISLRAGLLTRSGRPAIAMKFLSMHEQILRGPFPTAWMRVRLLRLRTARRCGQSLEAAELTSLRSFLDSRKIPSRQAELDRLLAS